MDSHELLIIISIIVETIAIIIGTLEILGFRVKYLFHKKDDTFANIKQPVSNLRKAISYIVVVSLVILVSWQVIGNEVLKIVWDHKFEVLSSVGRMLAVSVIAIIGGTLLGGVFAYLTTREKKYVIEIALTEIFVGGGIYILLALPAIVIIYVSYYSGFTDSLWVASVVALSVNLSPFVAKILIASFRSISKEQIAAAHAFGYSESQITQYFKLNYVLQYSMQPLLVEYYTTIKLSSLTAYIGFLEVLHLSQDIIKETQDPVKGYIVLSVSYIIIVAPLALLADKLDEKNRARKNE